MRVRHWIHHLSLPTGNLTWKRNRNQHCNVLLYQLGRGRLTQPFDRDPSDGPVGNLPSHVLSEWKASVRGYSGRKPSHSVSKARCAMLPDPYLFPCASDRASLQSCLAPCSPDVRSMPKPSTSESPVLHCGQLCPWTLKAKDHDPHRRSVSAQASLYKSQETQCLIPHDRYYKHARHATGSTSPPTLIQPVQATLDWTRTGELQKRPLGGCCSWEPHLPTRQCDMHRKVQQCQNLLNSRTDAQRTCSQKHRSGLRQPQSPLSAFDLTVPDMQVNVTGVPAQNASFRPPPRKQHAYSHALGQISPGEPPPSFTVVPSVSLRDTVFDGPSLLADLKGVSCPKAGNEPDLAAPRSTSVASSDDLTLTTSTCSSDRFVSASI